MLKDNCRKQNRLPQKRERKENHSLSLINNSIIDGRKMAYASLDLTFSDLPCTNAEMGNEAIQSENRDKSTLPQTKRLETLGVKSIPDIIS